TKQIIATKLSIPRPKHCNIIWFIPDLKDKIFHFIWGTSNVPRKRAEKNIIIARHIDWGIDSNHMHVDSHPISHEVTFNDYSDVLGVTTLGKVGNERSHEWHHSHSSRSFAVDRT